MADTYFITFSTYGTWLHGRETGSVDKRHNVFGDLFLPGDAERERVQRTLLPVPPYVLDQPRRRIVLDTVLEVARHRGWHVLACHVRTNHVHVVVHAESLPEKVMSDFKAYASRRLKTELGEDDVRSRWTQHGSTQYLFSTDAIEAKVKYVLDEQGEPMERHDGRDALRA